MRQFLVICLLLVLSIWNINIVSSQDNAELKAICDNYASRNLSIRITVLNKGETGIVIVH